MKIVIVTNIPAPYRVPVFNLLSNHPNIDLTVIYCAKSESNRKWNPAKFGINYDHLFLKENFINKKDGFNFIHNNYDVINALKKKQPDVIITTGYSPTFLYAWLYSINHKIAHIPMTDGWLYTEESLSFIHKFLRKVVFKTSKAFIGASKNSLNLFKSYKIQNDLLFQSCLAVDNDRFSYIDIKERQYDVIYSGHLDDRKNVMFLAEILIKLNKLIKITVLILGSGNKQEEFFQKLDKESIDYHYAGFVDQNQLPNYYNKGKVFLFPTKSDAWGVVVNEAMASGTPVISSPYAGVVKDLIIDGVNGYIRSLDVNLWVDTIIKILNDEEELQRLSTNSMKKVEEFNYRAAAQGIVDAVYCAFSKNRKK